MPGGLPSGGGQFMIIEGRYVDKASPEFKRAMAKMKGAAQKSANQMGGMINDKMGRQMSQFNEKTEKGRQLLTAFGGAAGGAAGQVVYYTGTLSYVVGRFTKIELGIMGALAAATALGVAFYTLATQDMQKVIDAAKKIRGELNSLNKAARAAVDAELYKLAGVSTEEQKIIELKKKWGQLAGEVAQGEAEIQKHLQQGMKAQIGTFFAAKATREEITKSKKELKDTEETLRRMLELQELKAMLPTELVPITQKGGKPKGGGGARKKDPIAERQAQELRDMVAFVEARQRMYAALTTLEGQYEQGITAIMEQNADRRERIAQNEIDLQQRKTEAMMNNIAMIGTLSNLVLSNVKQTTAAQIASILIEAAVQSAMETAAGFASLADLNPGTAALHFIAAGLYAAVGIGKAAGVGGGGGGASVGARERGQGSWTNQEPEKGEGLTIHIHAGVLTGSDAGKEILNAIRQNDDAWNPGRTRKGMGF